MIKVGFVVLEASFIGSNNRASGTSVFKASLLVLMVKMNGN